MSTRTALAIVAKGILMNLDAEQVKQVYSGKPGCGCGCRGKYSEEKSAKTRVIRKLQQNADAVEFEDGIFSLETETRSYWVYLS